MLVPSTHPRPPGTLALRRAAHGQADGALSYSMDRPGAGWLPSPARSRPCGHAPRSTRFTGWNGPGSAREWFVGLVLSLLAACEPGAGMRFGLGRLRLPGFTISSFNRRINRRVGVPLWITAGPLEQANDTKELNRVQHPLAAGGKLVDRRVHGPGMARREWAWRPGRPAPPVSTSPSASASSTGYQRVFPRRPGQAPARGQLPSPSGEGSAQRRTGVPAR